MKDGEGSGDKQKKRGREPVLRGLMGHGQALKNLKLLKDGPDGGHDMLAMLVFSPKTPSASMLESI